MASWLHRLKVGFDTTSGEADVNKMEISVVQQLALKSHLQEEKTKEGQESLDKWGHVVNTGARTAGEIFSIYLTESVLFFLH